MIRTHSVRVLWARGSRRIVRGIWAALFFLACLLSYFKLYVVNGIIYSVIFFIRSIANSLKSSLEARESKENLNLLPLCCSQTSCDCYFLRESSGHWLSARSRGIAKQLGGLVSFLPVQKYFSIQIINRFCRKAERWPWWA